jgi:tetratricopeptide (TPR) repeat protein
VTRNWVWLWVLCFAGLGCAGPAKFDLRSKAVDLNDSGYQYYRESRWELAREKFTRALELNRLIDRRVGIAANLNNLGVISLEQGDLKQAQADFQEALTIQRELGDPEGLSETLNNLGTVYQAQGRLPEAQEAYQEALNWARLAPASPLLALSLMHLGDLARARGDYASALSLYQEALEIDKDKKDRRGQAVRWERLGRTLTDLQEFTRAAAYLRDALQEFRRLEDTNGIADALKDLTRLALAQGDLQGALLYGERLLKIYQARGQEKEAKKFEPALRIGGEGQGLQTPAPCPNPPPPTP